MYESQSYRCVQEGVLTSCRSYQAGLTACSSCLKLLVHRVSKELARMYKIVKDPYEVHPQHNDGNDSDEHESLLLVARQPSCRV